MDFLQAIFPNGMPNSLGGTYSLGYSICNLLSIIVILASIAGIIYMFIKEPKESK